MKVIGLAFGVSLFLVFGSLPLAGADSSGIWFGVNSRGFFENREVREKARKTMPAAAFEKLTATARRFEAVAKKAQAEGKNPQTLIRSLMTPPPVSKSTNVGSSGSKVEDESEEEGNASSQADLGSECSTGR